MTHSNSSRQVEWLLKGDPAIQYQSKRDLLGQNDLSLRDRILQEGWGARLLGARNPKGHWGRGFYQPKWTSSHYTLLDLKYLAIDPKQAQIRKSIAMIAQENKAADGGIHPIGTVKSSDVCINGMFLNYACYFGHPEKDLHSIIDFILGALMADGAFNCHFNRKGAQHSSLHSTLSVLEGIQEYTVNGYQYRLAELQRAAQSGREFILQHHLYKSDRTGKIIKPAFIMLSYPPRWRYDILRALAYFAIAKVPFVARMQSALDLLIGKGRKDGTWPLQARHAGATHFEMEKIGKSSRWNTLRALRVLRHFDIPS